MQYDALFARKTLNPKSRCPSHRDATSKNPDNKGNYASNTVLNTNAFRATAEHISMTQTRISRPPALCRQSRGTSCRQSVAIPPAIPPTSTTPVMKKIDMRQPKDDTHKMIRSMVAPRCVTAFPEPDSCVAHGKGHDTVVCNNNPQLLFLFTKKHKCFFCERHPSTWGNGTRRWSRGRVWH